jgi:hypothetical protein
VTTSRVTRCAGRVAWGFVIAAAAAGCSSGGGGTPGQAGHGGSSAAAGTSGPGSAGTGAGTAGTTGAGGTGGGFTRLGVCAQRGMATATATSYDGYEEFALIGDEGLGDPVCVVRFTVKRAGNAPAGCTDCSWTQLLEYTNPMTLTNVEGACANSDLALDAAAIAQINGSRVAIGFAREYQGAHGSARMKYFDAMMKWDVFGNATWDEATSAFRYDYRDGLCGY